MSRVKRRKRKKSGNRASKQQNSSAAFSLSKKDLKPHSNFETVTLKPTMGLSKQKNNGKANNNNSSLKEFVRKSVNKVPFFKSTKKSHNEPETTCKDSKPTTKSSCIRLPQFAVEVTEPHMPSFDRKSSKEIIIPKKVPTSPICEGKLLGLQYLGKCGHSIFSFDEEYSPQSSSSDLSHIFIESQEENSVVPEVIYANYPLQKYDLEIEKEAYCNSLPTDSELHKLHKDLKYTKYGSVYSNLNYFNKPDWWLESSLDSLKSDRSYNNLSTFSSVNSFDLEPSPNSSFTLTSDKPNKCLPNPFRKQNSGTNSEHTPVIVSRSTKQFNSMLENPFLIPNYDGDVNEIDGSDTSLSSYYYQKVSVPKYYPIAKQNTQLGTPKTKNTPNFKVPSQDLNDYFTQSPNSYLKNTSSSF